MLFASHYKSLALRYIDRGAMCLTFFYYSLKKNINQGICVYFKHNKLMPFIKYYYFQECSKHSYKLKVYKIYDMINGSF